MGRRAERGRAARAPLAAELSASTRPYGASRRRARAARRGSLVRAVLGGPVRRRGFPRCSRPAGSRCCPSFPRRYGRRSAARASCRPSRSASLSILLSTVSIVGIELTEVTIRLAVAALRRWRWLWRPRCSGRAPPATAAHRWSRRREALTLAVLAALFVFSYASSLDIARPFLPEAGPRSLPPLRRRGRGAGQAPDRRSATPASGSDLRRPAGGRRASTGRS